MTIKQRGTLRERLTITTTDPTTKKKKKRDYYTPWGLAKQLPGRNKDGHASLGHVYQLQKEGMPHVFPYAGMKLLPVTKLEAVLDWLETRKTRSQQEQEELNRRLYS